MNHRSARSFGRILFVFTFSALITLGAVAEPILSDQFGDSLDAGAMLAFPRVILLRSSEREAAARIAVMEEALKGAGGDGIPVLRVADLAALPFFVPRSAVTGALRKNTPDLRIFLDWKGELTARLSLPSGSAARAYAEGRLVAEARLDPSTGKPEAGAFAALVAALGNSQR
ncbi:MAG: hypothetical protein WCT14_00905 [Treponemataceae bacterium]